MITKQLKITPIESLKLSKASYNHLKRAGFRTVFDVNKAIEEYALLEIPNIGEKLSQEIQEAIQAFKRSILNQDRNNQERQQNSKRPIDVLFSADIPVILLSGFLGEKQCAQLDKAGIKTINDLRELILSYQKLEQSDRNVLSLAIDILTTEVKELILQGKLNPNHEIARKKIYSIIYTIPVTDEERQEQFALLCDLVNQEQSSVDRLIKKGHDR